VFWTRGRREERRQKVLDELLELDPEERRQRLNLAVAAGDMRADEVDGALQLVQRLDALRVMSIPPNGRTAGEIPPDADQPVAAEDEAEAFSASDAAPAEEIDRSMPAPAELEPPIAAEPAPEVSWLFSTPLPIDAVEAAGRLIARDMAARKGRAGARPPRQRIRRAVAGDRLLPAPIVEGPGAETPFGERGPSIS
jgi:hypothetical protein